MNANTLNAVLLVLANKALKAKHLSTENFFKLIATKKKIGDALQSVIEAEKMLIEEYNAKEKTFENGRKGVECDNPEFIEKMKAVQEKNHEIPELNFIPAEEFKKFVDDMDLDSAALLYEFFAVK